MQGLKSMYGAGAAIEPLDSIYLNPTVGVLIWKKRNKTWIKAKKEGQPEEKHFHLPLFLPHPLVLPSPGTLNQKILIFFPLHPHILPRSRSCSLSRSCSRSCSRSRSRSRVKHVLRWITNYIRKEIAKQNPSLISLSLSKFTSLSLS